VTIESYLAKEKEKERLMICISDSGIGMSAETIDSILNKNVHFTTYGTDNEKGSGLGLHLCKEFVALNHGHISIKSKPGHGSSFYISLPVA
jgi:two-component system sensor histidine kinase/response regulator